MAGRRQDARLKLMIVGFPSLPRAGLGEKAMKVLQY